MKEKRYIVLGALVVMIVACISLFLGLAKDKAQNSVAADDTHVFSDIEDSDWFYQDVQYVSKNGLMNGTDEDIFSPHDKTTRAMIVTILWRLDGSILENGKSFQDVSDNAYYFDAVAWASNHQIVDGYDDKSFGPNDIATREQMTAIIYRYAKFKQYDTTQHSTLDKYEDKDQVSDYAIDAIEWGNAVGIISGTSDTAISPKEPVERCQVAAILHRFCENYVSDLSVGDIKAAEPVQDNKPVATEASNVESSNNGKGGSEESVPTPEPEEEQEVSAEVVETSSSPELVVDTIDAKPGQDVQIKVRINNNPGILGMTLIAYYNEECCTLTSVENGDALDGVLDLTPSKDLVSGTRFVWDGVDINEDQIKDGDAVVMNFHIADNAPEGKIPINIKCYDGDAVNRNLESVPLLIRDGGIVVSAK